MKSRWFFTLLLIAALLIGGFLIWKVFVSQTPLSNVWASIGPEGENISALAIDPATPTTLYAGTNGSGVFKSMNGERNWSTVNTGLTNLYVHTLVIDPATPTTLYAGTGDGVFKSTDGGGNWNAINTGLTNTDVSTLAIDPATPTILYAGTNGGVFKSTDGGGNWDAINTGLTNTDVSTLAIDPATPTILYAETEDGVFKSTDGGENWNAINTDIPGNTHVYALAIDPATPTTLYAGTGSGVFKSTNNGGNWNAVNTGLTNIDVSTLAIDPATPTTLYAGTGGGVFKSTDGGENWSEFNTGLTDLNVRILAINPKMPTALYAGTGGSGVFIMVAPPAFAVIIDGPWPRLPAGTGLALDKEWSALTLQSDMTKQTFVLQPDPDKTALPNSVWDMKTYDGRLYLGYGDLWNNRGPVDIVSYDPLSDTLHREMLDIPEEQVGGWDTTADGQFYVGGQDSQEGWTFGSFYVNDGLGWQKRRTIYKGLHVNTVVDFQGRLYAGYSTDETSPVTYTFALVSNDQGVSWTYEPVDQAPVQYSIVGDLDTVYHATGEYLYAIFYVQPSDSGSSIQERLYRFDGNAWEQVVISDPQGEFLPGEILAFQGQLLVSGYVHNAKSGYYNFAVYALDGQAQTEVTFLRDNYVLWNSCNVHDGWLYCIVQTAGPAPASILYRTADLHAWETLGAVTLLPGASPESIGFAHDRLYVGATNTGWWDTRGMFELWPTEVYTIENATLRWEADVPKGAQLSLRIRSTTVYSYSDIFNKPWVGPDGTENTAFTASGAALHPQHSGDNIFQVSIYKTPNSSGESPLVKRVTLQTSTGSTTLAVDEGSGLYTAANSNDSAEYLSSVFQLQEPVSGGHLFFEGATPPSTTLRFQVRSAPTQDQLTQQQFVGPDGTPTTLYQSSGQALWTGHSGDTYLQYRALLASSDPAQAPFLHKVVLATRNDQLDHFSITDDPAPWVAGQAHPITVTAHWADGRLVPLDGKVSLSAREISRTQALPLQPLELTLVNGTGTVNISLQQATPTQICANLAGVTSCSSALNVQSGAAAVISVTTNLPSSSYPNGSPVGQARQPVTLTLAILDRYHNIVPGYTGTVRCERWQWKSEAQLFPPYTFQPSDQGQISKTVVIENSNEWNLACFDQADSRIAGTQTVNIQAGLTPAKPSMVTPTRTKPMPIWEAWDALSIRRHPR
jgi:photosystem II stability/assembly factor-like uncharacterized protein